MAIWIVNYCVSPHECIVGNVWNVQSAKNSWPISQKSLMTDVPICRANYDVFSLISVLFRLLNGGKMRPITYMIL